MNEITLKVRRSTKEEMEKLKTTLEKSESKGDKYLLGEMKNYGYLIHIENDNINMNTPPSSSIISIIRGFKEFKNEL